MQVFYFEKYFLKKFLRFFEKMPSLINEELFINDKKKQQ